MAILNSKIILAKGIKMDREYNNVLSFGTNQILNILNSTSHYVNSSNTFAFIGGNNTNVISCPFTYNECLISNYIAFQNPNYSNKWFFAFITNVIHKSNGMTQIEFEIDAWSTWFENWTKKSCYIIREHVNNDSVGANTVPENLDVGEVIEESSDNILYYGEDGRDYYFCINTTYDPTTEHDYENKVTIINGNLYGNYIFCFDVEGALANYINNFIYKTARDGKIEAIQELYILPKVLIDNIGTTTKQYTGSYGSFTTYLLNNSEDAIQLNQPFDRTLSYSDYTPKNNKCFVYPYNYLLVSNNVGNSNIYKYENFNPNNLQTTPMFELQLSAGIGGSGRLVPRGYKNIDYDYDESLPLGKFPTCSWSSDAFTNWLTQNAINIGTEIVSTGATLATGNLLATSGQMAGIIGQFRDAILQPNITGGNNTADVNFAMRQNTFILHHMRCKTEYMRIIDDYFSRFGYAINRVLEPNIIGRENFNYVEIGSTEEIGNGDVPVQFMEKINNACRRGVTIWHNHENIGNFNVSNNIV